MEEQCSWFGIRSTLQSANRSFSIENEIKTNFADIQNIGGRYGGAITAAAFLAKFTEGLEWAHLDIAGTAWDEGANKGSTGRPVSLLIDFVRSN